MDRQISAKKAAHMTIKSWRIMKKRKFLQEIQRELEDQRRQWSSEIERLTEGPPINEDNRSYKPTYMYGNSSNKVFFKAFFDVREFEINKVNVAIDGILNKVVVTAVKRIGDLRKKLTQKVNIPRYADTNHLTHKIRLDGILEVTIPLLYHFPLKNNENDKHTRNHKKNTVRILKIFINLENEIEMSDIDVEVIDDKTLMITGFTENRDKILKKKYLLPYNCIIDDITAEINEDYHLNVHVPFVIS